MAHLLAEKVNRKPILYLSLIIIFISRETALRTVKMYEITTQSFHHLIKNQYRKLRD